VVKVAVPAPRVIVPSAVPLSINVTEPVAVEGATVAVSVTLCANADGLSELVKVTVVAACVTVCVSAGEVLAV
jgi:hypothetical protein